MNIFQHLMVLSAYPRMSSSSDNPSLSDRRFTPAASQLHDVCLTGRLLKKAE